YVSFLCVVTFFSVCSHHSAHHRHLHSFPTRRSSDLTVPVLHAAAHDPATALRVGLPVDGEVPLPSGQDGMKLAGGRRWRRSRRRSEEHTSELQSRSDLVCRLLLEKKKK